MIALAVPPSFVTSSQTSWMHAVGVEWGRMERVRCRLHEMAADQNSNRENEQLVSNAAKRGMVRRAASTHSFVAAVKPVETSLGHGVGDIIGLQDVETRIDNGSASPTHMNHRTVTYILVIICLFAVAMAIPNLLMHGDDYVVDWNGSTELAAKSSVWMLCRSVPCFIGLHWACVL